MQDEALKRLTPLQRRLYAAFQTRGSLKHQDLQSDIELADGRTWQGRPDTYKEIEALRRSGLLYISDTVKRAGPAIRIYTITPADKIDAEARKFKQERRPPKRSMDRGGEARRIAEYRRQEKEAGTSARAMWIERRRRVVELTQNLRRIEPMAYWRSVDDEELEMVYEEVADLLVWARQLVSAVDTQRGDRQLRDKIAALRAKADSTEYPGEADSFRAKAHELEAALEAA